MHSLQTSSVVHLHTFYNLRDMFRCFVIRFYWIDVWIVKIEFFHATPDGPRATFHNFTVTVVIVRQIPVGNAANTVTKWCVVVRKKLDQTTKTVWLVCSQQLYFFRVRLFLMMEKELLVLEPWAGLHISVANNLCCHVKILRLLCSLIPRY